MTNNDFFFKKGEKQKKKVEVMKKSHFLSDKESNQDINFEEKYETVKKTGI